MAVILQEFDLPMAETGGTYIYCKNRQGRTGALQAAPAHYELGNGRHLTQCEWCQPGSGELRWQWSK